MKLHLPIALLAAVVGAMSFAQANNTPGSYEYSVSGEPGYFTQDTSIHFTGDWTNVNFENKAGMGDGDYGYNGNSDVGGLLPVKGTGTANNVNVKVGSDDCATNIGTVIGVGPAGYAAIGNKVITVTGSSDVNAGNYTYVGAIIGANNISATSANGYVSGTYEVTGVCDSVIKFAKKTGTDKNITINVEGGSVGQIRGGGSGHSGKIDTAIAQAWKHYSAEHAKKSYATDAARQSAIRKDVEAFVADGPWMRNEQIYITVGGDSKVGYKADGVTDYEIGGEAAIYGAGGTAHSVNNDVNITVTDNAVINGNVLGGAVANTYNISGYEATAVNSSVNNTHITITGDSKVDGNVYGGGWSKKTTSTAIVKGNTEVVLEGGTVTGDVYGAGYGDLVEGNTKVVIKGEGATVNGTIYGGGENGANVNGDKILAFDNYTANTGADGYAQVKWVKDDGTQQYQGFNVLQVNEGKVDLGDISSAFETLNLTSTDVKASSLQGEQIQLNMTTSGFKVDGELNMAEGSTVTGYPWSELSPVLPDELCDITATEINGNGVEIQGTYLTATEGGINISDSVLDVVHFKAVNGTVSLKNIENFPSRGKTVTGVTVDAKGLNLDNTKLNYKVTGSPKVALDSLQLKNASEFIVATGAEIGMVSASGENNKFVQGGEGGDVKIDQIWLFQTGESDGTVVNSDLTIEQRSGENSNMSIGHIVGDGSTSGEGASVKIEQKGKGSIDFNGWVMGAPVSVSQTGGGTVTVNKSANVALQTLNVTNGSTFENLGTVSLEEVAVSYAALLNGATLTVTDVLKLEGANIGVIADTFVETGSAIMLGQGAQITGLDSATFSIVFAENAMCEEYNLSDMLADPTLNGEFQVDIIGGLDTTLAQEIAAAFTKDMLTLQATDANGNLVDMIVWDAQMTNVNGTLTISGSASVPEPTTATLSLLALAALAARRRRK